MGRPKVWLPFGPERLLQRVVRLARGSVGTVVVVAGTGQELPDLSPETVVVRDIAKGLGPLAGLAAGLEAIVGADLVYATGTDAPFLAHGWVDRLAGRIGAADAAIPHIEGQLYSLAAVYRRETVGPIVQALRDRGRSRLRDLAEAAVLREVGADELCPVDPDLTTLTNVNTPEEYRTALLRAGFSD